MTDPIPTDPEAHAEVSVRLLWQEAVGKVFKLTHKVYGVRTVTYTQVKSVKDVGLNGDFHIEVVCAEIMARVLTSKRTHSAICKEGVLRETAQSELYPESFGVECPAGEYEKVTDAILAHANTYLDWVMQEAPEENTEIEIPIDLPHIKLTDMEASLVRNSPFLIKDLYFLTANSVQAGFASIQQELQRASRNMRLTDAVDPVYVKQKNDAVVSLREKLKTASLEPPPRKEAKPEPQPNPMSMLHSAPPASVTPAKDAAQGRRSVVSALEIDSIMLALLGKPSATRLSWERPNPSEECVFYHIGQEGGLLEFVRWAHVSGRILTAPETASRKLQQYFKGFNDAYTGPDKDGIYPLMKPPANS